MSVTSYQIFLDFVPEAVELHQSQPVTFIFLGIIKVDKELSILGL